MQREVGGDFTVPLPMVRKSPLSWRAGQEFWTLHRHRQNLSRWRVRNLRPPDWTMSIYAVLLTKTASCISLHEEQELKHGDCCVSNTLEVLERDWQQLYEKWFVRVNSGQRMQRQGKPS